MSDSDSTVPNGFRVIPGFPRYAINESGIVLSVCPLNGRGKNVPWANAHIVTHVIRPKGYHVISLCGENGIKHIRTVHALVLEVFVGPCPDGLQCRRLDGNPANNHVLNLKWGTSIENANDKTLHGTASQGERCNKAKLTNEDVVKIRERRANGESLKAIAQDFSINIATISRIALRQSWKHI